MRKKKALALLGCGVILLAAFACIFGGFFPNASGCLGHDYAFFLPALLDGYFWYHSNGLWAVPWFTPAFCGGSLNFINVYSVYYSLPQLLTAVTDPLSAVRLTLWVYAALGLAGFYALLRCAFGCTRMVALFGGALFLFNGFFVHRMLSGHLGYHAFMLLPLAALCMLRPLPKVDRERRWRLASDSLWGGLLLAAMLHGGMGPLMPPALIALTVIGLLHGLRFGRLRDFFLRWAAAGLAAAALCAAKLTATAYLMANFPRSSYPLPGAENVLQALLLAFRSLFVSPAFDPARTNDLVNLQWPLARHEWEYSLSVVPLVFLVWGALHRLRSLPEHLRKADWPLRSWMILAAAGLCLSLPLMLNVHSPGWHALLKRLPLMASASNLIRWFLLYIPVVVLLAALAAQRVLPGITLQRAVLTAAILAVIAINAFAERRFYHQQDYDPAGIVSAYQRVKSARWKPAIGSIGVYRDRKGEAVQTGFCNDMLVHGASQLLCYEPLFGYRLETFPLQSLQPGPVLSETNGRLNLKNPACYVWPSANHCRPGDHFDVRRKRAARDFAAYRPYAFEMPIPQKLANRITLSALAVTLIVLLLQAARTVRRRRT